LVVVQGFFFRCPLSYHIYHCLLAVSCINTFALPVALQNIQWKG
jgi:hypothetical protein